jgi:ABC-type uncharacterized transport system permease subunit
MKASSGVVGERATPLIWLGRLRRSFPRALPVAAAIASALVLTGFIFILLGLSPIDGYLSMLHGSIGTKYGFGQTLMVATPLMLTGLAAAIPFSARLWNVGGDGQFYAGAICSVVLGLTFVDLDPILLTVLCMVVGAVGGAAWGFIPGILKVAAHVNEVIVTIMLNFLGALLADLVIAAWSENIQQTTRPLPAHVGLPLIWSGTPVNLGLPIAVATAVAAFVLLQRTPLGLAIRAVGMGSPAARLAGFDVGRIGVSSFLVGGACAGLAGAILVVGVHHALLTNMSAGYGLTGVAVALVANLNPLAIIPAAFFFAVITTGASNLTAGFGILTSASYVIIAVFVILLLAFRLITFKYPET